MAEATYLYAIAPDLADAGEPDVTAINDEPLRRVVYGDLAAYVSTVPLDEFGEAAMRRNLEDLAWLERTARAHDRVVAAVARTRPTAPVRLVTIYADDSSVRALLESRAADFGRILARVTGRREWGVKVYARPDEGEGPATDTSSASPERPGTAYLKRRRNTLRAMEEARRVAAVRAEGIHARLSELAVAGRVHPPQDPQLSGRSETMLLNSAYLVENTRESEFSGAVEALREPSVEIELVGPWAPYSFAVLDDEEMRAAR